MFVGHIDRQVGKLLSTQMTSPPPRTDLDICRNIVLVSTINYCLSTQMIPIMISGGIYTSLHKYLSPFHVHLLGDVIRMRMRMLLGDADAPGGVYFHFFFLYVCLLTS